MDKFSLRAECGDAVCQSGEKKTGSCPEDCQTEATIEQWFEEFQKKSSPEKTDANTRPANQIHPGMGDMEYTVIHQGVPRYYIVHVPPSYDGLRSTPVVLNFHGGGGNAMGMIGITNMDQTSDKFGFIVVYPNGNGAVGDKRFATWNAGRDCCGIAKEQNIDDVGFVREMIEDLDSRFNIDRTRVYATGLSNGALFSYRLACELSDQIAAIAPVAGVLNIDHCNPARAVPILDIKGRMDPCIRYEGGVCGGCLSRKQWTCQSTEENADYFKNLYQCGKSLRNKKIAKNARRMTHSQCRDESEVSVLTVENAGHQWPGDGRAMNEAVMGPHVTTPNINEIMWEFFKKHSLENSNA